MPAIDLVDPTQNELLASLEAKSKNANPFFRAMAHRPEVLKNFLPLYSAVMGPGAVERRLKILIYLACSYANRCTFCLHSNLAIARKIGFTEDETTALRDELDGTFTQAELAAIRYARELTRTANAEAFRDELRAHFTSEQTVEITLVAAMANFTNRFNNGLQILP